ncbi:MAG: tail fiber protein, partial [Bacteroidota bacterium]
MHSSFFTKAAFVAILIMLAVRVPSDVFAKPAVAVEPATTEAPAAFSEPFIGTISMFAGNFAPRGWAFCDGQLLPISEYNALYSILGTTYGGDGRTTFGLPDLRGRVAMHPGNGPGLSSHRLG